MKRYIRFFEINTKNIFGYDQKYKIAIDNVVQKAIKKFNINFNNVSFHTYATAPEELITLAIRKYGTTPPAIMFPQELIIIMKPEFYDRIGFMKILSHEIGHLLDLHFGIIKGYNSYLSQEFFKGKSFTRQFKNVIIPQIQSVTEIAADIFANYILDLPLEPKKQKFINFVLNIKK